MNLEILITVVLLYRLNHNHNRTKTCLNDKHYGHACENSAETKGHTPGSDRVRLMPARKTHSQRINQADYSYSPKTGYLISEQMELSKR